MPIDLPSFWKKKISPHKLDVQISSCLKLKRLLEIGVFYGISVSKEQTGGIHTQSYLYYKCYTRIKTLGRTFIFSPSVSLENTHFTEIWLFKGLWFSFIVFFQFGLPLWHKQMPLSATSITASAVTTVTKHSEHQLFNVKSRTSRQKQQHVYPRPEKRQSLRELSVLNVLLRK